MFGGKKRKLVEYVMTALQPFLMVTQKAIGIPSWYWDDDYVLGFLGFLISFHMTKTSQINSNAQVKGEALVEIFTRLSNSNGLILARKYNELTISKSSSEFEDGADNAMNWIGHMYGLLKNEGDNADVEKAIAFAATNDREQVSTVLLKHLYLDKLKDRQRN